MKSVIRILALSMLLAGCSSDDAMDRGVIHGYDMTYCACCGGYVIEIEGNTFKFFDEDISGNNPLLGADDKFPIEVYIDWKKKTGDCPNRINVLKVKRRK